MTVKLGKVDFLNDNSYTIIAKFTTVTGLRIGSPVNILGIDVGRVEEITIDQENLKAVVKMKIKKNIKIYEDAIASIKTEGLIGEKYLSIYRGGGGSVLSEKGVINDTQAAVDIEEMIGKYAFGEVKKEKK